VQTVNIHAAKTQLSRLVDKAAAGQEIVIARAGRPVARLVPLEAPPPHKPKRVLGALVGRLQVPADFDAPLSDDELADFEKR
jgi:prevent-host-death family protein